MRVQNQYRGSTSDVLRAVLKLVSSIHEQITLETQGLLDVRGVARLLNVSTRTVEKLIVEGQLTLRQIRRKLNDTETWVKNHQDGFKISDLILCRSLLEAAHLEVHLTSLQGWLRELLK